MICKFYRFIKSRVGCSLKRTHCRRHLVPPGKQFAYQLPRTQGSLSSLTRVPRPLYAQDSTCRDGQHHSGVIHKQRRRYEVGPTCALLWRILTWCAINQVTLKARHIPGWLSVVADKLSRLDQTTQTEWSLLQEVFQAICNRWHRPQLDLFATRFNNKLPLFVSPVPDPLVTAVNALSLPW